MIDLALLRGENAEQTKAQIKRKEPKFDVTSLMALDKKVKELKMQVDGLRSEKNEIAKSASGGLSDDLRQKSIEIGKALKEKESLLEIEEPKLMELALACPNILSNDVQDGGKEANKAIFVWGKKPEYSFKPKNHLELNEKLNWFDFKLGAKISGSQQVVYRSDGLKMLYALTRLLLTHNAKNGHTPIFPPYLVSEKTMIANGSLPKFKGDFYSIEADGLSLLPTAEVTFTGMLSDTTFRQDELPLRQCAWTSCFRREAGGYGAAERGLIRIHQFEKVELYSVCEPEKSFDELERMVQIGKSFIEKLGLHYQVSLLAAQDCSFSSAKTYDLEVWLPGQGSYYEVSSCSNCTDFQARRAGIRYKDSTGKTRLAHTLNASSLALPRLMVAIIETYQQEDGQIVLPKFLQDEMDKVW